ncbi:MAG: OsmC family protein [Gammaproteobacteria bacterium]
MTEQHAMHRYQAICNWKGSTGAGYEVYDRSHRVTAPPAEHSLTMSSDPAFRGKAQLLNPEQLLVMAVASCQMLSFLAIAARARIDVVEYEDKAEGLMPEDDEPMRITRITLKPRIVIRGEAREERIRQLVHTAHEHCYIANSLKTEIKIQPEIAFKAS